MALATIDDDAPRSRRRVWAVTPYVAFLVAAAASIAVDAAEGPPELIALALAVAGIVVSLVSGYAVYTWQREWAHRPDEDLDERQRTARDGAYRSAYATLASVGAVALVLSQLALDAFDGLTITELSSFVVLGWFLLALCLPSSVLLWREQDLHPAATDA